MITLNGKTYYYADETNYCVGCVAEGNRPLCSAITAETPACVVRGIIWIEEVP